MAKLVEAVGEERYVEARLTGGFKYGPLRPVLRGPNDLSQENLQLLAAAGELQKAAEQDPSAERLHAWGVAQVLVQRTDEGVSFLERAAATGDARTFSDLGVALMSRSTALDRPADLPRALDVLEAALQADSGLVEAWFNKALLLERLGLRQQAIEAWTRYLNLERQDEWRAEGERRIAALRAQSSAWPGLLDQIARREPANDSVQAVAREFPEELRDMVARVYIPEWLLSPDPAAAPALRRRTLAAVEALAPGGGDALFTCALRELDATLRTGPPSHAAVAAVARFRAGLAAVEADRFGEAFQPLVTSVASPLPR